MNQKGKLYVVGIGPGAYEQMTVKAVRALEKSQVIVGYTVYAQLVREHFPEKEYVTTPMRQEKERCQMALDLVKKGKIVSMVCSGDSGVYGMSSLIFQLAGEESFDIEAVPGVTAALGGGALLGAPLGHDFAVISLSDLLTPMEIIEKRLRAAAQADFVICLYNPASKKRADYLKWACDVVLSLRGPETVCGWVKNIGREGETMEVLTLKELKDLEADMFTTVFIGSSNTKNIQGRMITPRGYRNV
ncbi:MAG TPA: precorrin-3B C(17)-methyltransferase [Candidatus Hungatella pullicola]|nr:precorrin-3B C(17)-methyltransferase [Candidatus Hungatella pullicola]